MPAVTSAAQPRSPLKRSATTSVLPGYHGSSSSSSVSEQQQQVSATSEGQRFTARPEKQQYTSNEDDHGVPSAALQAMHQAMCKLSSQHHMSDYNRMKRLTATSSQPMSASASYPLAARPPVASWSTTPSLSPSQFPSTPTLPTRLFGVPSTSPSHAADGYATSSNISQLNHHLMVDEVGSHLDPPPAPPLHRTYTEEEGQNPHIHVKTTRGTAISSTGMDTPALSMDTLPPSPPITSTSSASNSNSRSRSTPRHSSGHDSTSSLGSSNVPDTPPDSEDRSSASRGANLSPIIKKTPFDEHNDHVLSTKLMDAMDESVVLASGIPISTRGGGDTARIRQIQQQRLNAQRDQHQRQTQHSDNNNSRGSSDAKQQQQKQHGSIPPATAPPVRTSSIPMISSSSNHSSSQGTTSDRMYSSRSSSMRSTLSTASASADMSRASTSLTSAYAGSSSSTGMSSSQSALAYASTQSHLHVAPQIGSSASAPGQAASRDDADCAGSAPYAEALYRAAMSNPEVAGVKTSLTHPMNVSPLIPPELLPLYGQSILHAVPTSNSSNSSSTYAYTPTVTNEHGIQQRSRSPLGKLSMTDMPRGSNLNNTHGSNNRPPSPTKSNSGSAMHISRPNTPAADECDSKPLGGDSSASKSGAGQEDWFSKPFVIQPSADIYSLTGPNASAALFSLTLPISQQLAMTSANPPPSSENDGNVSDSFDLYSSFYSSSQGGLPTKLGNLVLSSCPGKKVRLSDRHLNILGVPEICRPGPGLPPLVDPRTMPRAAVIAQLGLNRSPICRDLEMDFRRAMSQADVKCVVCCIDDEEMRFLGAAWEEYQKVALKLGLEIIRLPMAEGFAPPSPEVLDSHLSYLITKYTLRGQNCLVHCRGGVGRAGLFACSWMIKLGLLGPITAIHDPSYNFLEKEMQIVENVIAVIRKRRSAKAIETPQQVQFILQYVHWLASSGRQVTATEIMQEVRTQG